ncbi:MAG: MBG domain-containing protein [Verrucomicrobiota bacterium]
MDIKIENAGIELSGPFRGEIDDAISLFNEANEIGAITSSVGGGYIGGNIHIADSTGDLTVSGDFSNMRDGANTLIATAGSLTLENDARFAASALVIPAEGDDPEFVLGAEVVLAATGGNFTNNAAAGAGVVTLDEHSRFLIYSDNPADTTTGGLAGNRFYGATYADYSPRNVSDWEGSFLFYSFQPTLTISADASRLYGQANPALAFTVTGLLEGDDLATAYSGSPVLSTAATSADNVGQYAIDVEAGETDFSKYNYALVFEPGTLTITPAPLTITADDKFKTQGGANPPLTASFAGLVNNDLPADIAGLMLATTADAGSPVGNYVITASGAANANYDIAFVNGTLTVNSIPALLITADSFDIRYGAPLPTLTARIIGFGSGDDESIVNGLTLSSTAVANSPVGTYDIVPANASAAGYEISYVNGTLTIDPALLTITAGSVNRFYGGDNPAFGVSYAGFVFGQNESLVSGLTLTTPATAASDAGNYDITPSAATAPNYEITFVPGTLTVNPAPLTITIDNQTKLFADLNPSFTYAASGFVLGQSADDFDTFSPSSTASQFSDVGDYSITASITGALAANYDLTVNPGTLTINRRPGTVTIGTVTREYGENNPVITVGVTGVAPAGTSNFYINNVVRGPAITDAVASSDVGVYTTTIADLTAANPNFDLTVVPGTVTVTPAPLTLRANNDSRQYGAENPLFTGTTTGLKLSDTLADVLAGVSFATAATITSNVGTYTITPDGTPISDNYAVTFTNGTLTVNRAPLTITPALATRVYGGPDPVFTVVASGLRNGDTESVIQMLNFNSTNPTWGVGSYPISIIGATATNYALTFNPGVLTVTPRPLTITANDFTREYGDPNPTFTASFDNLASFDTESVITGLAFSTPATAASNVIPDGGYGITVTSNANPNYDIGYEQGLLTITPAPLLVGLNNLTRVYGDTNPAPGVDTIFGFKGADTAADLLLDFVNLPGTTADAGDYAYDAVSLNSNYALETTGGRLAVTPAPLTVGIGDVLRVYADENPDTYTVFVDGLKFPAVPTDIVSVLNPTDLTTGTGTYAFGAESLSGNYIITSVEGEIRISPRPLNLTFTDLARRYGDAELSQFELFERVDLSGVVSPFDNPFEVFTLSTATNIASNVGSYPVAVNILNSNYMPGTVTGDLAITPRPLTVVLNPLERIFGQDNPLNYDSFRDAGGDEDLMSFDPLNTVLAIEAPANTATVGNYTLTATLIDSNYTLNQFSGSMSVLPRQITLQMPDGFRRIYGDTNPTVAAVQVLNSTEAENSGLAPFHEVDDVITFQLPDITADAGVYSFNTTLNPNYDATVIENGNVTIDARPIAIGLPEFTRLFGDANPAVAAVDLSIDNNSQGLASFDSIADALAIGPLPDERADAGDYVISWTASPNYDVSIWSGGSITIDPRRLAISAISASGRYGDGDVFPSVSEVAGESDGFASFDDTLERRREILFSFVADKFTPVGTYDTLRDSFPNYDIALLFGEATVTITPRPVTVTLPGFTRLYGDANPDLGPVTTAEPLPDFHTVADIIGLNAAPAITAATGVYPVVKTLNTNYAFTFAGETDYTISQRVLDLGRIYKTYGEAALVFSAPAGDGPASFDTLAELLQPELLGDFDINDPALGAGYYALAGFGLTDATNYRISADSSSVVTVLPRLVSIDIADVNLVFDTAAEVRDYFANENLVLAAIASGLVNGDDFDDAFPIIRYQLVDTDSTPTLPVVPTIENVVLPTLQSLIDNPSSNGNGVVLVGGPGGGATSNLPRAKPGTLTDAGVVLETFGTVFDGYDTEDNYVLGGVSNGNVRLRLNATVVSGANAENAASTYGITNFTLSETPEWAAKLRAEGALTVSSAANPPGLLEFFTGGNNDLGVEMILAYFEGALESGLLYNFAEGGLLAEITRSENGTLEDVTPFRIQRWLERNADNPAAMGLLAEPLANYTKDFLNKDPATHTESEAAFSQVLSLHMTKARNELAEQVKESHDTWVAEELAGGNNLADLYGKDVPYEEFFTEAGADYVAENIEAKIALTAGGAAAGAAGTGAVMVGLTGAILPYAVSTTIAATATSGAATTLGGSIAGGASVAGAGAVATVAVPVAIVAGAIVGSIARGIQVGENIEQQQLYNGLVNSAGTVDPASFELTNDSGKDDIINQTILLGALAGMLYP